MQGYITADQLVCIFMSYILEHWYLVYTCCHCSSYRYGIDLFSLANGSVVGQRSVYAQRVYHSPHVAQPQPPTA
jgi:hypothetical protein